MPDYSACDNRKCRDRRSCARYMMIYTSHRIRCRFNDEGKEICEGWWSIKDADWKCFTPTEMEIYELNMANLRKPN
jgi:hypothetical protein